MNSSKEPIYKSDIFGINSLSQYSNPVEGTRSPLTVGFCIFIIAALCLEGAQILYHPLAQSTLEASTPTLLIQNTLAVLALLIFLLVDESPETLGLGIFLSCEGLSRGALFIPALSEHSSLIGMYFLQMGGFFQLYFAFHLSRLYRIRLVETILYGGSISLILSLGAQLEIYSIPAFTSIFSSILSSISSIICFNVAATISNRRVPWRVFALVVAGLCFLYLPVSQILLILNIETTPALNRVLHVFINGGFTLAALINISTVENRVKALSNAKAKERVDRMKEEQKVLEAIAKTSQMLAHDVRKPFSLLKAYVDSLSIAKNVTDAKSIINKMIPDVKKSLSSVDQLIANIMDIGREIQPDQKEIELLPILKESLTEVFKTGKNPNIKFSYNFRHHGKILGDQNQLKRLFSNILENADHAIEGRPETITIKTYNDTDDIRAPRIVIEIHNTGSYIPLSEQNRVFDAFFTERKRGGTGLGLAIVKKISDAHEGSIELVSSQKDGTSFIFKIPAKFDSSQETLRLPRLSSEMFLQLPLASVEPKPSPDSQARVLPANTELTILLIDDEKAYIDSLKSTIFHTLGQDVTIIELTSPEIYSLTQTVKTVDLIICDYDFGSRQKNGIDILKSCHTHWPKSFRILHTNHVISPTSEAGFNLLLKKPLTPKDFSAALGALEKNSQRHKPLVAIIEDDLIFAENLENNLAHFNVQVFANPEEFLSTIKTSSLSFSDFDTIFTDMFFDGSKKTGVDLARTLRQLGNIRLILYSNATISEEEGVLFDHVIKKSSDLTVDVLLGCMKHG
jgi:signal transduction histidine kinase/ActR/RegA family two-component response regulator